MTIEECARSVNMLVRIAPAARRSPSRHYMRGLLKGVVGRRASVLPFGHRHQELVDPAHLKLWKSRNAR